MHRVLILPANVHMEVPAGTTLLDTLRQAASWTPPAAAGAPAASAG